MRAGESFTVTGPAMLEVKHVAKSIAPADIIEKNHVSRYHFQSFYCLCKNAD